MPELHELSRTLSRIEKLEREVSLKQLQVNSLLAITQAINDNVSADGLFSMYNTFLRWEIGIRKMALFFREGSVWHCATSLGVKQELLQGNLNGELERYRNKQGLEGNEHPLIGEFDLIIPVLHKDVPIAYSLLGGFSDEDDVYNKVQFVTTITNVIAVAIENKRMFKNQLQQEIVNREVELAAEIQRTLVPRRLPAGKNYQLSSIYRPHFAVGGDYYDVVEFADNKLAFCIADITGKGVAAALLMANFQANFRALVTRQPSLEELVREMNAAVFNVTEGDRFITLFIAKYDVNTHTLHYINAGHTPPILLSNGEAIFLKNGTTVLGFMPELPFLEIGGVCLTEEALLFTYTDGLTDIRNDAGEDFHDELLLDFLREHADLSAKDLNTKLLDHIDAFRQKQSFPDDITVLTCRLFK
jgi:sigma-B regulation protein RsbU (phosphoserine phosphatase)